MDDSISGPHGLLSAIYVGQREFDRAIAEGEQAVALAPGSPNALTEYAWSLVHGGRPEDAIPLFQKAIRLNPFGRSSIYRGLGVALRNTGRFEEAVSSYTKAIQRSPNDIRSHIGMAGAYIMMGREREARFEVAEVLRIDPKFSLDYYAKILAFKDQSQADEWIAALRKAGLK